MVSIFQKSDRKYIGSFSVIRADGKQILDSNHEVHYSLHQVILASEYDQIINGNHFIDIVHWYMQQSISRPSKPKTELITAHIAGIIYPCDPRCQLTEWKDAKKKEIEKLFRKGTWKLLIEEEVPENANLLTGGFVINIKDTVTNKPRFEARYVILGNKDMDKYLLVHNSTTMRQVSTRLLVALAAKFGFKLWSQDISKAYLQSVTQLVTDI